MAKKSTLAALLLVIGNTASAEYLIYTVTAEYLGVVEGTCNIEIDEFEPWGTINGKCTLEKFDPQTGGYSVITPSGLGDVNGFSLEYERSQPETFEVAWIQSNNYMKDDAICTMFRDITLEHWIDNQQDYDEPGFFANCIVMANNPPVQVSGPSLTGFVVNCQG